MVSFYKSIENYDKSIDYQYKILVNYKASKNVEEQLNTLYAIGDNYREAKKYNAAKGVFDAMGKLADSVKNAEQRTNSSVGYLNTILDSDEKDKALEYLRSHPDITQIFQKIGMGYLLDYGYANVYQRLEKKDSAAYFYEKVLAPMEAKASIFQQMDYYSKYAYHLYTVGNYNKAIAYLNKAKYYADSTKNSTVALSVVDYLDSCHQKIGDFKAAFYYASLKNKIKGELDEKGKAKDLLTLEIETENKRAERQAQEAAEETIKRHNWQYMAIIIAIISLFSLLAVMGVFNVSVRLVKALGFISFIFLFEFLILIADTWIHHATHGEPWKILAIKVVLIALLMPLHHWLEHKAIHFITTRRKKEALV
jgi:tetratricopeptide (TPR) repeat protein